MFVTLALDSIWRVIKGDKAGAVATRQEMKRKMNEEEEIKLSLFRLHDHIWKIQNLVQRNYSD